MNVKDGQIILCKGIKLDRNFENVLSYSESDLLTICDENKIATSNSYSILDPTVNSIDISLPYASCIYANYIAFKNPHYGNKWFFGFVDQVKYVSNNCTTVEYKLDVFSTWYSSFNIGKAFVEREHVSDDTIGKHTVPENLDTGDFIINNHDILDEYGYDGHVVVGVTKLPSDIAHIIYGSSSSTVNAPLTLYNGVFNGLTYIVFYTPYDSAQFIAYMDLNGLADDVVSVFIVPLSIYETTHWETEPVNYSWGGFTMDLSFSYNKLPNSLNEVVMADESTVTLNTTLDGYTPKNNKMFTKEFNYLYVTNNNGGDITYSYEDFKNNTPSFRIIGAVCPGCSIRLTPLDYKKYDTPNVNYKNDLLSYGLTGGKYPTCSWRSDTYTNWLTQNSVNTSLNRIGDYGALAVNTAVNPALGLSTGFGMITDALERKKQRETMPVQARGNINVGDVTFSCGKTNFEYFQLSCRYEFAKICDDYLSRFGYKVNEIKTPNLLSRTKFNYIKVGGMDELITGDIPARDLEEINDIFRKGVTIFHDYDDFGDYTINNPISNI